nr:patatin-like phospholipase RssA [uncultured Desulfuromonas sp.]
MSKRRMPKIGLALGSGSARGWSHIGVIKALAGIGIEPDIVCGCSIGSVVGAAYVSGRLSQFEEWVRSLTRMDVARFFELDFSLSGFVDVERLQGFFDDYVMDDQATIESLERSFATVATDLENGREIWFTEGSLNDAIWASIALPGIFPPVRHQHRWLVDGGLVNPVPVSICRALGAEVVIAVNLNGDIVGKHFTRIETETSLESEMEKNSFTTQISKTIRDYSSALFPAKDKPEAPKPPGIFEALAGSINITQDRITRSRMAGDPPDFLLTPKLSKIGLLEFYRADEAIREGEDCVLRQKEQFVSFLNL